MAAESLDSWSRQQIIDTNKHMVGLYCNQTDLLKWHMQLLNFDLLSQAFNGMH